MSMAHLQRRDGLLKLSDLGRHDTQQPVCLLRTTTRSAERSNVRSPSCPHTRTTALSWTAWRRLLAGDTSFGRGCCTQWFPILLNKYRRDASRWQHQA